MQTQPLCGLDQQPHFGLGKYLLYQLPETCLPESEAALTAYIRKALAAGIIHSSSSRTGAGFFFVEKKDKSL